METHGQIQETIEREEETRGGRVNSIGIKEERDANTANRSRKLSIDKFSSVLNKNSSVMASGAGGLDV